MIEAGRLRHKVTLLRLVETQDSQSGAMLPSWDTEASLWAHIVPLSARDFIAAGAAQNNLSARAVIRWRGGIEAGMRLKHGNHSYQIEGVLPDAQSGKEYLTLMLSESSLNA